MTEPIKKPAASDLSAAPCSAYRLATATTTNLLESEVIGLIEEGYLPTGGVSIAVYGETLFPRYSYAQAMILQNRENTCD